MSVSLKLISANIEGSKHLDLIMPFLEQQQPEVLCVQELDEKDVAALEERMGAKCFFVPMVYAIEEPKLLQGIGIFSKFPMEAHVEQYAGHHDPEYRIYDPTTYESMFNASKFSLAIARILKKDVEFQIGTTHMPVTYRGGMADFQWVALNGLLKVLHAKGEIVYTGDFNAPRGGEIFAALASKYKDNVPAHYETSLDMELHRAAKEKPNEIRNRMVDGIFSTQAYSVTDVELISGVSDHCAIVATISKS